MISRRDRYLSFLSLSTDPRHVSHGKQLTPASKKETCHAGCHWYRKPVINTMTVSAADNKLANHLRARKQTSREARDAFEVNFLRGKEVWTEICIGRCLRPGIILGLAAATGQTSWQWRPARTRMCLMSRRTATRVCGGRHFHIRP